MEEEKQRKKWTRRIRPAFLIVWLWLSILLLVVCQEGVNYYLENNIMFLQVSEIYDTFTQETLREQAARQLVYLYERDGWNAVNKYAASNGIKYALYRETGRPMGSNVNKKDLINPYVYKIDPDYVVKLDVDFENYQFRTGLSYRVLYEFIRNRTGIFVALLFAVFSTVVSFWVSAKVLVLGRSGEEKFFFPPELAVLAAGFAVWFLNSRLVASIYSFYLDTIRCMVSVGYIFTATVFLLYLITLWSKKGWIRYSILYQLGKGTWEFTGWISRHLSGARKMLLIQILLGLVEFAALLFLMPFSEKTQWIYFLWGAEKILVVPFSLKAAGSVKELEEATKKLAAGELDTKVQTKDLYISLRDFAENLNHVTDVVSDAVDEKLKSERLKTELITNVSHDIKTPLTSIINFTDLLGKEEVDNPKVKEYAGLIYKQSNRLKKLLEDLLEASKASTGNLEVNLEPCEAKILLGQCVGEYEPRLADKHLEFIVKQAEEESWIMADSKFLWRIFDNLMNNICKYAQPDTRVYLSTEKAGEMLQITFKNISSYSLDIESDELMERFVRGDLSRHTEGHGLGLSVVKSLMDLQSGKVSIVVDGDLFKVVLQFPLTQKPEAEGFTLT